MSQGERWGVAKCQRIQEKLEATVAGKTTDAEHLLDVLIAAWEEMHREAAQLAAEVRSQLHPVASQTEVSRRAGR